MYQIDTRTRAVCRFKPFSMLASKCPSPPKKFVLALKKEIHLGKEYEAKIKKKGGKDNFKREAETDLKEQENEN